MRAAAVLLAFLGGTIFGMGLIGAIDGPPIVIIDIPVGLMLLACAAATQTVAGYREERARRERKV